MKLTFDEQLKGMLLQAIAEAIERDVIPELKENTRVDTGALRDSTRVIVEGGTLYIVQGGTEDCDYAIYIEARYGDFSNALAAVGLG